jgi:hypothetical protein
MANCAYGVPAKVSAGAIGVGAGAGAVTVVGAGDVWAAAVESVFFVLGGWGENLNM